MLQFWIILFQWSPSKIRHVSQNGHNWRCQGGSYNSKSDTIALTFQSKHESCQYLEGLSTSILPFVPSREPFHWILRQNRSCFLLASPRKSHLGEDLRPKTALKERRKVQRSCCRSRCRNGVVSSETVVPMARIIRKGDERLLIVWTPVTSPFSKLS